jgi:predicted lipoprotein
MSGAVLAGTFAENLHNAWPAPRAADFARASALLAPAIQTLCNAPAAETTLSMQRTRQQWLNILTAWEHLSAVAIGPVLERRSQRQIDFTPTRPRLIEKAVKTAPVNAAEMELIGTPAKGLPALEWLLWVKPIQPASPECRYAVQVAAEIGREAHALASAAPASSESQTALSELVNQWIGGLERLRWANMEMPARVAMTGDSKEIPDFPRRASNASAASWAAQWSALRDLATGPVSLQSELKQRRKTQAAEKLAQTVEAADATMQGLVNVKDAQRLSTLPSPSGGGAGGEGNGHSADFHHSGRTLSMPVSTDTARILAAAKQLAALKRLVENEIAPALGVNIGFSDADGD